MALEKTRRMGTNEAVNRAATLPLPFTARTLTEDEILSRDTRAGCILLPICLIPIWLLVLAPSFGGGRQAQSMVTTLLLVGLAGTALILAAWYWRHRLNQLYCAAPIQIEVDRDRVTVSSADQVHQLDYATVGWRVMTAEDDTGYFSGVRLKTPIGELRLEDRFFERGNDAAAVIIYLTRQLNAPPPPPRLY